MSKVVAAYIAFVCFGAVTVACKSRGSQPEKAPAPSAGSESGAAPAENPQMVVVTADEAKAHGLPPIGMRVDASNTNLSLMKLPEPDKYMIASGPPSGPLLALVWTTDEHEGDAAAVERAVHKLFSQDWQKPLVIGEASTVTLAGSTRASLAFTTGESLRYTGWCGTLVSGKNGSVLVLRCWGWR